MNWQKLVSDIAGAGFTQQQIASHIGCSQSFINAVIKGGRGKNMKYEYGEKLIKLHKKTTKLIESPKQHV